jgi:hypothetical protein
VVSLLHSAANGSTPADAAAYTAPSGARVFSTGSFQYAWGLDGYGQAAGHVSAALQQLTRNVLNQLGGLGKLTVPARFSLRRAFAKGIPVTVELPIPGSHVRAELRSGKSLLASATALSAHGGRVKLALHPKRSARHPIGHRHSLTIRILVTPPTGARVVVTRTLRVAA